VSYFLTNHPPEYNSSQFNITGRAYPDVSAFGNRINIYSNGKALVDSGTSASTPLFASIITLINEKRVAANKTTVGFLNPALYANPDAFTDVSFSPLVLKGFSIPWIHYDTDWVPDHRW
jgi:tripeptidyl-peptidase-1